MGMYDYVVCEYPLPGNPPAFALGTGNAFQSKSFHCLMDTYTIQEDGRIRRHSFQKGQPEEMLDFTGVLEFYDSNITGSGPGIYTSKGEDAQSVDYRAIFVDGTLTKIEETRNDRKPALPSSRHMLIRSVPTESEKAEWRRREAESLMGKKIYLLWGGQDEGHYATVVAEDDRHLCVKAEGRDMSLVHRHLRDHIFFDTEEEAWKSRREREDAWNKRKREYNEYCEEWAKNQKETDHEPRG